MAKKKSVKKKMANHKSKLIGEKKKPEIGFEIQVSRDKLQGNYCNVAMIKHTEREFAFDFLIRIDNYSVLSSRVITNPKHAKEIYNVLGDNIKRYEKQFGEIVLKK